MWLTESPRLSPLLWLSASSSACHGLLIITVITPLPTKPSATKCQRTEAGERGNYLHADASAWCCCARCKNTYWKELADAKAENDALRDDVAAGRRRLHISSLSVSAWSHHAFRRISNAASDWQIPLTGWFHPQRGWSLCKNNWKEPRSILLMSSADRGRRTMGNSCNYCDKYTPRLQRSINAQLIKPSNPFTNVCWVSVLTTFSYAATNFGCIDSFLRPIPENEEMMGDGF